MRSKGFELASHGLLVIACLAAGHAAADEAAAQQRALIAAEKDAVQKRYEAKERDCAQRFVVTSCINAARKERRDALAPLRQDELRIDTVERKQRAADRLEEIEIKQRADAAKEAGSAPEAAPPPQAAAAPGRPASAIIGPSPRTPLSAAERERREAESQARFEANRVQAEHRRQAAEARNAQRAASGKVVRPLPLPPGASAP